MPVNDQGSRIFSSTYSNSNRSGENYIGDHMFSYQVAGSLSISEGEIVNTFNPGDFRLSIRNKLAKFIKHVEKNGEYHSISVVFGQALLREIALENGYKAHHRNGNESVILLQQDPHFHDYITSLTPFLPLGEGDEITKLKIREAIFTLLKVQPELKDILFDFREPAKIDIAAFMEQNFRYNLSMHHFAYMTGRSISSFKRDFQVEFRISPGRWLLYRRLKEAYFLIKEQGRSASDVYITVGFEDISHFSRCFKRQFGVPPSKVGT